MQKAKESIDFPEMERGVLEYWQKNQIFRKQDEQRQKAPEFNFYDGPPFANGLPHYGHLLANTIKDSVPRYWIMKGYKVRRRFGWDCHGLPVEFEIEKRENLKGRPDILKMGIATFNEHCRSSVLDFAEQWQKTITRLGRWVDWDDQYRTMDRSFMESVWWVFKQLHQKGLVYRGFKVVPYSPRTSSVVSNFEANQNYKDVQDPAITVKFKSLSEENTYFLAWTTTPWTLPGNLALAVGPNLKYLKVRDKESGQIWILAEERLTFVFRSGQEYVILDTVAGSALVGQTYQPLFDFFAKTSGAFRVLAADFVGTENGSGIVHLAPAFGEDDFYACQKNQISPIDPTDANGCFDQSTPPYAGLYFKDADKPICKDLKERGLLLRHETIVHSYPFDDRTDTPLMYKTVPSWYVAVETFVDRLVANNQEITWVPDHLRDGRMGSWLKNARDWAISRNRFWGTPIPVWVCNADENHIEVFGAAAELESRTGQKAPDLHKHFIAGLTFKCQQCSGKMQAVDAVFDCWFESGSMPYAQLHYPFENKERFNEIFPADFVAEGLDQTRGWFYTLNVLSTALWNKPAFKNVVVNGTILDSSGKKMSKRRKNYTAPDALLEQLGADSVRLYMLNSPLLKGENLIFVDAGVKDITRAVLLPLSNAYSFLATYANAENWQPPEDLASGQVLPKLEHEMDRFIVSRLQSLIAGVDKHMQDYKLYLVLDSVLEFIEDLCNWYIRVCRRRFWGAAGGAGVSPNDQKQAFECLFYVMHQFLKIMAPFTPFIAERLYLDLLDGLKSAKKSVHLCDFPKFEPSLSNPELEQKMQLIRTATMLGRSLRQKHKIKVRQVLPSILIISSDESSKAALASGADLLGLELNVKNVDFSCDEAKFVRLGLKPNLKTLGKKLGANLNALRQKLLELNTSHQECARIIKTLEEGGSFAFAGQELKSEDFLIERGPLDERLIATEGGITVLLDTKLTPELIAEGLARELINRIQNLRKDSGFDVSDRILLNIEGDQALTQAASGHKEYILQETLGVNLKLGAKDAGAGSRFSQAFEIEGHNCQISLELA